MVGSPWLDPPYGDPIQAALPAVLPCEPPGEPPCAPFELACELPYPRCTDLPRPPRSGNSAASETVDCAATVATGKETCERRPRSRRPRETSGPPSIVQKVHRTGGSGHSGSGSQSSAGTHDDGGSGHPGGGLKLTVSTGPPRPRLPTRSPWAWRRHRHTCRGPARVLIAA